MPTAAVLNQEQRWSGAFLSPISSGIQGVGSSTENLTGVGALLGVISGAGTVTGNLASVGALLSTIFGVSSLTGNLTARGALFGVISGKSSVTGNLTGTGALLGGILGASSVSADLVGAAALLSVISGTGIVTGNLTGAGSLLADIEGASAVSAALTALGALLGAISGASSLTGNLTGVGTLLSTVLGASSLTGDLFGAGVLFGDISSAGALSGALAGSGALVVAIVGDAIIVASFAAGAISSSIIASSLVSVLGSGTGFIVGDIEGTAVLVFVPTPIVPVTAGEIFGGFGCTAQNPAIIQTTDNQIHSFTQPLYPFAITPSADNWASLGYRTMAGELLAAPGSGFAQPGWIVAAAGDITIPVSASNATVNLILTENLFSISGQSIVSRSDVIATLSNPISLASGTYTWSLECGLFSVGPRHGFLTEWAITIGNAKIRGIGFSVNPPQFAQVQLSLSAQFGGTVSGTDVFQARATQFEFQQR